MTPPDEAGQGACAKAAASPAVLSFAQMIDTGTDQTKAPSAVVADAKASQSLSAGADGAMAQADASAVLASSVIDAPNAIRADKSYQILNKRADFMQAAQARRQGTPSFLLQARERNRGLEAQAGDPGPIRVGFTCSKKVGNAVARNRAKRRLREIARLVLAHEGRAGWDYVLVGRKDETATREFQQMLGDLRSALSRVHR